MFNFIRVLSLVQGSGWEFLCFLLHTIRLQVRERRRGWRGPTVKQGLAGCKAPTWPVVRARKPNSLALPAGVREPNQSAAPGLARSDEGTRACGVQGANMEGRAPGKRRRGWRGPTKEQGLVGCTAPTWKAALRENGAGVGAVRRRNKGLRGARRQHEWPPGAFQGALLAQPAGGTRACGVQGANMPGHARPESE